MHQIIAGFVNNEFSATVQRLLRWEGAHIEDGHILAIQEEAGHLQARSHQTARVAAQVQNERLRTLPLQQHRQ